jgi:chromosomal replication initiation ATPase DnaA
MDVQVKLILKECEAKIQKHSGYKTAKLYLINGNKSDQHSIDQISEAVCAVTGVPIDKAKKKDRSRDLVITRQLICLYARGYTPLSFREISEYVGLSDHTSCIHNIKKVMDLIEADDAAVMDACKKVNHLLKISNDRSSTTRTPDGDNGPGERIAESL